ncbi:MAG TPA: tetratricopeptide repeat protein [Thermoanaerobaculia bacterium]|nr:tetratricopeptide repeat protein [Thermoanaerobaculia bacterium]
MKAIAAAAALLLAALPAVAQRGAGPGGTSRVPGYAGWPRVPRGPLPIGEIAPERRFTGAPFRGTIPLPPPERQWIRLDTPHFRIISSAGERRTRAIAEDFEKLTALLTRTSPFFRIAPVPTQVFIFGEHRDAQPYFDAVRGVRVEASGITFRHSVGSTMLLDAGIRGGDAITPRHELVHDLLRSGERPLPLWIEEGLAEYYSNAGMPIREHASRMYGGLRMPFAELFALSFDSPRSMSFDFYAQSWATVTTLMRRDPRAFFAFLRDIEAGTSVIAALRDHYRMSPRELEVAIRTAGAPAPSLLFHGMPMFVAPARMRRAEVLTELGSFLGRVKGREYDAERHFRAALAEEPHNSAVYAAYADALVIRPECVREARVMADRALDFQAGEARAHAAMALSYLAERDHESARPYLERAYAGHPERIDVAFPLFALCMESGEREKAESIFLALADTPKVTEARKLLLRADIPRADALAREGKLIEAARVLRELAPKMPGKTRANLETQAASLEAAARRE